MFKLLATGALFLQNGATKGGKGTTARFRKPPTRAAGAADSYLTFTSYGDTATDCSAAQPVQRGAILVGLCATINSTSSADYQCADAAACVASHYASQDCSGPATETIKFPTSGDCELVQDPSSGDVMAGKYTQTANPTSVLGAPYLALYEDEDCSADPVVLNDRSLCNTFGGQNSSNAMRCADGGVLQGCQWPTSGTCADKGQCTTLPKNLSTCTTFPYPVVSYAKASQYFCTPPPSPPSPSPPPSPPRALLSSRARLATAAAAEVPRRSLAGKGTDVFYPGYAKSNCYRIPTIIRVNGKDTVLAFAENRQKKCSDSGDHDIVLRRSTDGGKSWGKMITVAKGKGQPFSNANPVQVGQRILLHYDTMNNPTGKDPGSNMQTWSKDDGKTWSSPTKVKFTNAGNDGNLIGPSVGLSSTSRNTIYFVEHNGGEGRLYWSKDGGNTWTVSADAARGVNECSIAFLVSSVDGRIVMNCRTGRGKRAQAVWSPDGKIVDKLRDVDGMSDPNCQGSIIRADGKLWVSHPDSTKDRVDMIVQSSSNQGRTWSSGIEVNKGRAAYSQLVDLGGSKDFLGILYESDKGHITFDVVA